MATHVIVGWVVLAAALTLAAVVIAGIAAALRSLGRKGGPEIPGHIFVNPSSRSFPELGSLGSAQCYWDCMSGFHWDEDWKERCAPACGLTEKHE